MTAPRVRIRGMYATALTHLCHSAGFEVVDPSEKLATRFENSFETSLPDVTVTDVDDWSGVRITGDNASAIAVATELASISRDSFLVEASLDLGAIFSGEIAQTSDSGALVTTDGRTGFLPYGEVDGYVDEGEMVTVQVIDPQPPWLSSRRPVLSTQLRIPGVYVSLMSDCAGTIAKSPDESLALTVERLVPDLPGGWGIAINSRAENVELANIRTEIEQLKSHISRVEEVLESESTDDPGVSLIKSMWCRFGREGRFSLDNIRGEITPTIEGHHRIKAIGRCGGSAVDLLEGYGLVGATFDPDVVFAAFGPAHGDRLTIEHGKPDGSAITLGRGEVIERKERGSFRIQRVLSGGGTYDALGVPKAEGDRAETTFIEGRWWYPTVYRSRDGTYKGTYVNIGTPIEILPDRIRYVDLFVDVVKTPDDTVHIVDQNELEAHVKEGIVSPDLATHVESVAEAIVQAF